MGWLFGEARRRNLVVGVGLLVVLSILAIVITVRAHQTVDVVRSMTPKISAPGLPSVQAQQLAPEDVEEPKPSGQDVAVGSVQAWLDGTDTTGLYGQGAPPPQGIVGSEMTEDVDTYQSWSVALDDGSHVEVGLSWYEQWRVVSVVVGA